ncbi:Protein DEHYDRATION-INDUCED 5 [Ananas comosus]|uniref:Protein DEHYDRATION-INDUCED 5 n=1 Tax=Ananas comosus TaxID=4615 RepID=A0A199UYJ5_ANACO|nr:Protein DEHYDRATION-INDUCED 5 [Ananas comosus]
MEVIEEWRVLGGGAYSGRHKSHTDMQSGEEDLWEYFPCPFCYIDVEVPFLCDHLQEEHCFDTKNAVCPMCADNPGKDMITHFVMQHSHLLKRRRSHKASLWMNDSGPIEKERYEISSFSDVASNSRRRHSAESAPDPLLSSFLCNTNFLDTNSGEVNHESELTSGDSQNRRSEHCLSNEQRERDLEEKMQRIEFLRQVIASTIF